MVASSKIELGKDGKKLFVFEEENRAKHLVILNATNVSVYFAEYISNEIINLAMRIWMLRMWALTKEMDEDSLARIRAAMEHLLDSK
ncbi:hypothetical protein SUGI_0367810 [Cryptomeria japonica]|nr:hypothetical protein SUGI_0367810 [Cryptomeria japonica]